MNNVPFINQQHGNIVGPLTSHIEAAYVSDAWQMESQHRGT